MRSAMGGQVRRPRTALVWLVVAFAAGCGLDEQRAPTVVAPSEFGLSVTATARPDQLPRDGVSFAEVTVLVRNASNQAVRDQRISVSPNVGDVTETSIVTDAEGRATFGYTAPPANTVVADGAAVISLLPVGGNAGNGATRTVSIRLTGSPNSGAPVPAFTFLPAAPEQLQTVTFDASGTTDEGRACEDACTYAWDFGGEASASGRTASHRFRQPRTYAVTLTVTDPNGTRASKTQGVPVTSPAAPTASFTASPTSPGVLQNVNFVASASRAATGHSLVQYDWSFGDGGTSSNSTATTQHSYSIAGTYTVTLTVTDDVGQTHSATATVTVGAGITANFTISPSNPKVGATVNVNAGDSTTLSGSEITSYSWNFGNGATGTGATATTSYTATGTYTISLTVRDSAGRTATVTKTVTVS